MNTPLNTLLRHIYRNLPNIVSIVGVLPLCILLREDAFVYLCPLIVFNNIMDDLDGILAKKLGLRSEFGAGLDNVCDAVAHILIAMVVGSYYSGVVLAASLLAAVAILVRVVQRLAPSPATGTGTPTNELMRHLLLLTLLQELYGFNSTPYFVAAYILNSASMLVPFAMPHLIRSQAKSATAVLGVNAALVIAWCAPITAPFITAAFFGSFLYSFVAGGMRWLRSSGHA
ncbi:MAG: CDP-alcohol phosphatidyltransferase family protein [Planctomycetota bacterium]|nr:CDP-alcohol phosphatidyltransferase family protein [Planctomycetota bacterium]